MNLKFRASPTLRATAVANLVRVAIVVAAFCSMNTIAQTAAAKPVCDGGEYHKFDFWIGDWDTYDLEDKDPSKVIARNHVDPILEGCVLREDYDQFDGHHGQSFTIWDATRKVWHQSWVTNRGELLVLEGTRTGSRITFEGNSINAKGVHQRTRVFWEPQGADVRETATVSEDGGKTFKPLFDIVFRKHKS